MFGVRPPPPRVYEWVGCRAITIVAVIVVVVVVCLPVAAAVCVSALLAAIRFRFLLQSLSYWEIPPLLRR